MENIIFEDYHKDFNKNCNAHLHLHDMNFTDYHKHNYWEFFIVIKGRSVHNLNGVKTLITKNFLQLIRPFSDLHSFFVYPNEKAQQLNVMLVDSLFKELTDVFSPDLYREIAEGKFPMSCQLDDRDMDNFLELLNVFQTLSSQDITNRELLIKHFYCDMLKVLQSKKISTLNENHPAWLQEFLNKIHSSQYIGMRVEQIYGLSNFSHVYLLKQFKAYMDETLIGYLTKIRMEYAASLLVTTDFKLIDISSRIGYDSLSHFLRLFKKYYGMSPTEYRQRGAGQ